MELTSIRRRAPSARWRRRRRRSRGLAGGRAAARSAGGPGPLDAFERRTRRRAAGPVGFDARRVSDAPPLLLDAARRLEPFDRRAGAGDLPRGALAAIFAGRLAGDAGVPEVAAAVWSAPPSADPPRATDDCCSTGSRSSSTRAARRARPCCKRALAVFCATPDSSADNLRWRWLAVPRSALRTLGRRHLGRALSARMLARPDAGALACSDRGCPARSGASCSPAISTPRGASSVGGGRGARGDRERSPGSRSRSPAYRGREAEASELIEATRRRRRPRRWPWARPAPLGGAVLFNGLGRYERGAGGGRGGRRDPSELCVDWALGEVVEAAARSGRPEAAATRWSGSRRSVAPVARTGRSASRPRSRALVSDGRGRRGAAQRRDRRLGRTACGPSSRAHTCSTANGCAARGAASTPASNCARRRMLAGWARSLRRARPRELAATGETVRKRTSTQSPS